MKIVKSQKVLIAEDGCIRFKENKIVRSIFDRLTENGYSLNNICIDFDVEIGEKDNEDYRQLMQLIGYSISGYGDLSTVPKKEVKYFDKKAAKIPPEAE